jgi:hypothetical protein
MRKYDLHRHIVEEERLKSIECDKCHRVFIAPAKDEMNDLWEIQEFVHIHKSCGYGSIIGDEDIVEIDLCQRCFKLIIEICIDNIEKFVKEGNN